MSHENGSEKGPVEVLFDIAKPSGPIEFLGLMEGRDGPGRGLSGLFSWTCPACNASNRDVTAVESQRPFLTEWSCKLCSQPMLVRFQARAAAEWTAQHALAMAGTTLSRPAGEAGPCADITGGSKQRRNCGQRIFGWIAVPALAAIIVLGVSDQMPIRSSSASSGREVRQGSSFSYAWLGGYWVNERSNDTLYFGYVNPAAQCGTYTRVARDGRPARIVRFQIVHEEATDERLVLRERDEPQGAAPSDPTGSDAILYISRHGTSMVRMTMHQGEPVLTAYRHFAKRPARE